MVKSESLMVWLLENSASIYKYLVLTHYQKADIQQQFNISDDKIEVIPHFQHQLLTEPSGES